VSGPGGMQFHRRSGPLGQARLKTVNTKESPTGYRTRGPSALRQARVLARRAAKRQPPCKCDRCGKLFPAVQSGATWVNVPASDISTEEIRDRCAACSAKRGPALPYYGTYVEGIAYGRVP
jgi:hypothetical protein